MSKLCLLFFSWLNGKISTTTIYPQLLPLENTSKNAYFGFHILNPLLNHLSNFLFCLLQSIIFLLSSRQSQFGHYSKISLIEKNNNTLLA